MNSLFQLITRFRTEESCIEYLEKHRWPEGIPVSPFIPEEPVYKLKNYQYKGKISGRVFNVKYGTIFWNTKLPLLFWFSAIGLFLSAKRGVSSYQMAKYLNVTQKTAYRILMSIRSLFTAENQKFLHGVVQCDECFIGPKGDTRYKHIVKAPVLGLVSRRGCVMKVIDDVSKSSIYPVIEKHVRQGATIFTDEYKTYVKLPQHGYHHYACNHERKIFVDEKTLATTNAIENLWKHFKLMLHNYNCVKRKYLQLYVDEYVFRFNNRDVGFKSLFIKLVNLATQ